MADEWGPWIEHDGKGCPCVGHYVHVKYKGVGINPDGSFSDERCYIAQPSDSWVWGHPETNEIIRYRIRKPRGMAILEAILANPPKKQVSA